MEGKIRKKRKKSFFFFLFFFLFPFFSPFSFPFPCFFFPFLFLFLFFFIFFFLFLFSTVEQAGFLPLFSLTLNLLSILQWKPCRASKQLRLFSCPKLEESLDPGQQRRKRMAARKHHITASVARLYSDT